MIEMPATAEICDSNPKASVADLAFRDYGGSPLFFGPVETVRCFEDNTMVRRALESPGDGRVLVVDGGGSMRCALVGAQLGALAVANGWGGVVVEGCVRDIAALRLLPLGVRALGASPLGSAKRGKGHIGVVVRIGRMDVRSGWWLYADEDGIVTVPEPIPTSINEDPAASAGAK